LTARSAETVEAFYEFAEAERWLDDRQQAPPTQTGA
jgi:hypothetical protein